MKSLVADDDYINRMLLQAILERYGRCDLAENGVEAVNLYLRALDKSDAYDLICLDISMPKMDGLKALHIIRKLEQDLLGHHARKACIMMATSFDERDTIQRAFELGCEEFIVKPINLLSFEQSLEGMGLISVDQL